MWRSYNLINSFTLEASFCGSDGGSAGAFQYSAYDLKRMGKRFGQTLHQYFLMQAPKETQQSFESRLKNQSLRAQEIKNEMLNFFQLSSTLVQPDESASSDTTSDDDVLRTTKKKITVKKKSSIAPSKPKSPPAKTKEKQKSQPVLVEKPKPVKRVIRIDLELDCFSKQSAFIGFYSRSSHPGCGGPHTSTRFSFHHPQNDHCKV